MASVQYLLKKLEEKKQKKAERERLKKEREAEKLRLKKIEHKKKLKSKQNKRCYAKRRKQVLDKRKSLGDERAYFMVLLTKNRKRIKRFGASWWKTDAYKIYNDLVEQNHKEVKFSVKSRSLSNEGYPVKYEIILVKRIKEGENEVTQFRDDSGKFIDNIITDKDNYIIIAKDEWFFEETFYVYGYHPIRGRKTYDFILNEILLKDITDKSDIRTVMTYNNKLFIRYTDDFDFITCKNSDDAVRLYSQLQKETPKKYNKNIIYLGEVARNRVTFLIDEMVEKTGWTRMACRKATA